MSPLFDAVRRLLESSEKVVVAIDGPCASGKTTLARHLAEAFDGAVIHMDDFFLQPHQRSQERLAQVGGNVDRERFLKEVLVPLKEDADFSYRPYLCHLGRLGEPILHAQRKLTVVEGSYSHHPDLSPYYDLRVFLTVSPEEQRRRLEARSPQKLQRFLEEWIPMEEAYFQGFDVAKKADLVLQNEEKES